ncbi:MAG TPA: hypothetical protein VK279_11030 [Solirubrobacteraceae bacterium]|nr:hypothetical protein [Solirubrobacteraceae bacterium]
MTRWTTRLLVVANVTADSDELLADLTARAQQGRVRVHLVVPVLGVDRAGAERRLARALEGMAGVGIEATGEVMRAEPLAAAHEAWQAGRYDAIVVSTLPTGTSKWLRIDLPRRLHKLTDALVHHVVAEPRRAAGRRVPLEVARPEPPDFVTSLVTQAWGKPRRSADPEPEPPPRRPPAPA